MRAMNAAVESLLAAGRAVAVWGNVMLHVVKLRSSGRAQLPHDAAA